MKNCVLIVVEEIDVRARIARVLTRSGYAVELASNEKRALKLASDQQISTAIVGLGSGLAGFAIAQELRDAVPKLLVLVAETSKDMNSFKPLVSRSRWGFVEVVERRGTCRQASRNDSGFR